MCNKILRCTLFIVHCTLIFVLHSTLFAQHAKREVALSFAAGGQLPIGVTGDERSGFWREPLILNLRFQVATDYITSASLFLERIGETRTRTDLWSDAPNATLPPPYNAEITEQLTMTLFGIEGARTLVRSGDFRLAVAVGAGYGLGSAKADVTRLTTGEKKSFETCDIWHGVYLGLSLRGRYTLYQADTYDIGLTGSVRTWGFPTIGPFGDCVSSYNGPDFRALYEIGYLAGISIGFF